MGVPAGAGCPYCGADATEESVRKRSLSKMGYLHTDVRFDCSECSGTWVHGVPEGETDSKKWVCDSCGGDYMPHFLYVNLREQTVKTRPKCVDCNHVPEDVVVVESVFSGESVRAFVGHHSVTGDRTKAEGDPI